MTTKTDTSQINAAHDLRKLAAQHTALHRESVNELSGPCPRCGGEDRFHATATSFFCRTCYPLGNGQPHDAIAFVRWLHGASFQEAIAMLSNTLAPAQQLHHRTPPAPQDVQTPEWIERQSTALRTMQQAFWDSPAYTYAIDRGFTDNTLDVFGVGYAPNAVNGGPALALPWYRKGELYAIRYRYLSPTGAKIKSEPGSHMRGLLFGGQALPQRRRPALLIVEGELNAMSIWQVANEDVDVLSLGGQDQTLSGAAIAFAKLYAKRIVWMDDEARARARAELIDAGAMWSGTPKLDANDHLRQWTLRPRIDAVLAALEN